MSEYCPMCGAHLPAHVCGEPLTLTVHPSPDTIPVSRAALERVFAARDARIKEAHISPFSRPATPCEITLDEEISALRAVVWVAIAGRTP